MPSSARNFLLIGVLSAGVAATLAWQQRTANELRADLAGRQRVGREQARLQAERTRLEAERISPQELAHRREERAALTSLVTELEVVRRRIANPRPAASALKVPGSEVSVEPVSLLGHTLSAAQWRNAGQATPEAAFETVLWAAAGGDLGKLTELLVFDDATRTRAAELFARLPAPFQQELATPEKFVALLTAYNVPLGSAQVVGKSGRQAERQSQLAAQLTDRTGEPKEILFTLQTPAETPNWRLVVPPTALDRYAVLLGGETAQPR